MSRRTSSSGQTVSLFPFLAVLVCVMGSLIFLLLATTKRLRDIALAEAAAQRAAAQPASIDTTPAAPVEIEGATPVPRPQPVLGTPTAPVSVELAAEPALPDADPKELKRQQELEREWRDKLAQLEARRAQLREALRQQMRSQQLAKSGISDLEDSVGDAETRLRGALAQIDALKQEDSAEADIARLEEEIIELRKKLRLLQNRPTVGKTKFAVVPFDARSGTTRRPILIECTGDGLRFVSEDIVIKPSDLEGFTDRYNPLLAGSAALIQYWTAWNKQQPHPEQEPEPYVLLIVRPNGTVAYYVAMQMLSALRQPFGYELVEEGVQLQPPPTDELAKDVCRQAIDQMLAERSDVIAHARNGFRSRRGSGGSGAAPPSKDTFEVSDVLPPSDEVGERSWEKPERYEGRRTNDYGSSSNRRSPSAAGSRSSAKNGSPVTGSTITRSSEGSTADPLQRRWPNGAAARSGTGPTGEESKEQASAGNAADSTNQKSQDRPFAKDRAAASADNAASESSPSGNPPRLLPEEDPAHAAAANLARQRQARRQGRRQLDSSPQPGDLHLENLSRRHWGDSDAAARIGIEQDVTVRIDSQRILVAEDRVLRYDISDPPLTVFLKLMDAVDAESRTWGKPRPGFYWTPRLKFVISPGGNQMFERIDPLMIRSGLSASREFTLQAVRSVAEEVAP